MLSEDIRGPVPGDRGVVLVPSDVDARLVTGNRAGSIPRRDQYTIAGPSRSRLARERQVLNVESTRYELCIPDPPGHQDPTRAVGEQLGRPRVRVLRRERTTAA